MTRPGPETSHSGAAAASFSAGPPSSLRDPEREILPLLSRPSQQATGARKRGQRRPEDLRPAVYTPRGRSSARGLPDGLLAAFWAPCCRSGSGGPAARSPDPRGDPLGAATVARAQTVAGGRDPQLVAGIRARALGGILQLQPAKIRKALPLRPGSGGAGPDLQEIRSPGPQIGRKRRLCSQWEQSKRPGDRPGRCYRFQSLEKWRPRGHYSTVIRK